MARRISGIETEYGCLVDDPYQDPKQLLPPIRDWLFEKHRYGLIDQHERDWDAPAGNGGFLFNGGRIYIDMEHIEYCTPECISVADVVRYDRAGDLLLLDAVRALGLRQKVHFIRNNVDHYTGATFGCHENYSLERRSPLHEKNVMSLLTFLTLRVLFTGAGRVGSTRPNRTRADVGRGDGAFQISQRADYIQNDFFEWVQHNRAIINTRDEPLADPRLYRRLHLIHGDSNVLPAALFLKVGTTRLVLDLLDADEMPDLTLGDAVSALRQLSRVLVPPWSVTLADGRKKDGLEMLEVYRQKASALFRGRDAETDAILQLWEWVHQCLASNRTALVGIVDWITKEFLFQAFREEQGLEWGHPWFESLDLEYHQIDPDRSLALPLAKEDGPWCPSRVAQARHEPPANSRAHARSRLMREIVEKETSYFLDWEAVEMSNHKRTRLLDPFQP